MLGYWFAGLGTLGTLQSVQATQVVDQGQLLDLLDLKASNLTGPVLASLQWQQGDTPMPSPCLSGADMVCRKHFAGGGAFTIHTGSPAAAIVKGTLADTAFMGSAKNLTLQLAVANGAQWLTLERAQVEVTHVDDVGFSGRVGGVVDDQSFQSAFLTPLKDFANALVLRDCASTSPPTCGCLAASEGATLISELDTVLADCSISANELTAKSNLQPDIDLTDNGVPESYSFALTFSVVDASWP